MVVSFFAYIFEGSVVFISNIIFLAALWRSPGLMQRYWIIFSQIFADAILGLATLVSGMGRTIIVYSDITTLRSKRFCMFMPWNLLFAWAEPMTAVAQLTVSIDRLLLIAFPLAYCKRPKVFQLTQIAVSHGVVVCAVIDCWITSYQEVEDKYSPLCWTKDSMVTSQDSFFFLLRLVSALLGVILYLLAYGLTRKYAKWMVTARKHNAEGPMRAFQRRQAKLTVTMGISCLFAVLLYVMPVCVEYWLGNSSNEEMTKPITVYTVISTNLNSLSNLIIVFWRQDDIAHAVKSLLGIKLRNIVGSSQQGFC